MFHDELKRAREGARLSGREIARRAGISSAYYSQLETGTRGEPPEPLRSKLVEVIGVPSASTVQAQNVNTELAELRREREHYLEKIAELERERDFLRGHVASLVGKLPDAKPSPGAAPVYGASGGAHKERRGA